MFEKHDWLNLCDKFSDENFYKTASLFIPLRDVFFPFCQQKIQHAINSLIETQKVYKYINILRQW